MKHYIFLLLSLLTLASCAEQDISGGDGTTGSQSGLRLSARLSPGAVTRALGDPFASGKEEKRIDRLAFFVHTAEDGFQVYPPVPDDVTDPDLAATDYPNAVYLSGTPETGYEATVALTAGGGYMADIIAIANLPADYDYRQIVTWEGLCDSVALHAATMPVCLPGSDETNKADRNAFVMYGDIRKELKKEETNSLTFALQRLVARIDITNEAYAPGTIPDNAATGPENSFFLTSARLLHAQPVAFVVPKPDVTPDVVTTSDWAAITGIGTDILYGKPTTKTLSEDPTQEPEKVTVTTADDAKAARLQYAWHTLYTYPNSDTEHAPTALEIKGTFRGTEITRQIPFVDKDGKAFPVEGNHRYLVRIVKAPGQTDIDFNIAVSEWDAVDTVQVKPDQTAVPVIENLDGNGVYLEKEKRYDVYYKSDGLLTFDATCNFSTGVRVKYYDSKNDTWTTQGDWVKVEKTAETPVTKAIAGYKSSFKITFDKFDTGVSRKAMLLVHNGGSEVECDTIFIKHTLTFPGTDLEPVAFGSITGHDVVWAPVNLGATRLPTKRNSDVQYALGSEELQNQMEEIGLFFQWGRRFGVQPSKFVSVILGPISKEELLSKHEMEGVLIGVDILPEEPWLTPPDRSLWGKGVTKGPYDPCPGGWRVPNKDELHILFEKVAKDGVWDDTKRLYNVSNGSGMELVLSETAYLWFAMGGMVSSSIGVRYWCSDSEDDTYSYMLDIQGDGNVTVYKMATPRAYPVRCIQE